MKIIRTHEMDPRSLTEFERDQRDGLQRPRLLRHPLDVYDGLRPQLDNITASTYDFSKSLKPNPPK